MKSILCAIFGGILALVTFLPLGIFAHPLKKVVAASGEIDLQILGVFLRTMVMVISFSLVVIFQPELRRFLGYLGQGGFFAKYFNKKNAADDVTENVVHELIESVKYLKKTRTGALIVLEKEEVSQFPRQIL